MEYIVLAAIFAVALAAQAILSLRANRRLDRRLEVLETSVDMLTRAIAESQQPKPKRKYTRRVKPTVETQPEEAPKLAPWENPATH